VGCCQSNQGRQNSKSLGSVLLPHRVGPHNVNPDIQYWDPETQSLVKEEIYGEKWLRFSYDHFLGQVGLWALVKRAWFSRWYGSRMDHKNSREKIAPFIRKYNLKVDEFLEDPESFQSFNEFFYRKLRPSARPIQPLTNRVVFPADGRHLLIPDLSLTQTIYAKGQSFDLVRLLGDTILASYYERGSMLISRLCPVDYHRFHFPCSGRIGETRLINGSLFSVNPIALRKKLSIFWENKRYCSVIENSKGEKIVQLLIGATCVGKVHITSKPNTLVNKGDEYGYFAFGGSCVITIFPPSSIKFNQDLVEQSNKGVEYYAQVGQCLGTFDE